MLSFVELSDREIILRARNHWVSQSQWYQPDNTLSRAPLYNNTPYHIRYTVTPIQAGYYWSPYTHACMHSCQVGATVIWEYTKQVSLSSLSGVVMDLNHLRINQDASSPATPLETELLPGLLLFLFFDPQWVFVGINLPKSAQRFQPPRDCRTPRFGNQFIMNHMNNLFFKH